MAAVELSGDSHLHTQARKNYATCIPLLLRDIDINIVNARGETALMVAAQTNAASVVQKLLCFGADLNAVDNLGNTALHYAVYHCSRRTTTLLCTYNADANIRNIFGKTPLHIAAQNNTVDIHNQITKYATNINFSLPDNEGYTPFLSAVQRGNVRIVKNFLRAGYKADECDNEGKIALHLACSHETTNTLRLFPFNSLFEKQDVRGDTPLLTAVRLGNERAVDWFLQNGAFRLARDLQGNTMLHIVCLGYNLVLLERLFSIPLFIDKEPRNELFETPLHLVCREGKLLALESLLPFYPSLNVFDRQGRTPLMLAIKYHHTVVALALLAVNSPQTFQVDIHSTDLVGNTPLHYCSMYENPQVAVALLRAGADIDVVNQSGYSPFTILSLYGDLIKLIQ